jgi:hypothetical protein
VFAKIGVFRKKYLKIGVFAKKWHFEKMGVFAKIVVFKKNTLKLAFMQKGVFAKIGIFAKIGVFCKKLLTKLVFCKNQRFSQKYLKIGVLRKSAFFAKNT